MASVPWGMVGEKREDGDGDGMVEGARGGGGGEKRKNGRTMELIGVWEGLSLHVTGMNAWPLRTGGKPWRRKIWVGRYGEENGGRGEGGDGAGVLMFRWG